MVERGSSWWAPVFLISAAIAWIGLSHVSARAEADGPSNSTAPAAQVAQGLRLTFNNSSARFVDVRVARMVALHVKHWDPPTPFFAWPDSFTATWEGDLNMRLRDSYVFAAEGRGKLTVTFNGKPALEVEGNDFSTKKSAAIRLSKGKNQFVARYESPPNGDAWVRLLWMPKGETIPEPIPPTVWTYDSTSKDLATSLTVREGRFLFAEYRCVRCHAGPGPSFSLTQRPLPRPMRELEMDAPSLADVGRRLNQSWISAWVKDPRSFRPDAHMPRVLSGTNAIVDARAADVGAYLASLGARPDEPKAPTPDVLEAGGRLFTNLNCIACHTQPSAEPEIAPKANVTPATSPRVPLCYVKLKYKPTALVEYLLSPESSYHWNPMPNFRLSPQEAEGLAAFLISSAIGRLPAAEMPAGDAARGKQLMRTSGCVNCHSLWGDGFPLPAEAYDMMKDGKWGASSTVLAEIESDAWLRGCMAVDASARKSAPDFGLRPEERAALMAFRTNAADSVKCDSEPEFAERQIAAMRCTACHARDGRESLLATVYDAEMKDLLAKYPTAPPAGNAEAFSPDQRPPTLTWAGEKLQPRWMADFIAGNLKYKPRPYLHARMPAFPARAAMIAGGLAEEHGYPPTNEVHPDPDPQMSAIGQGLAGKAPNKSFSCVQCHAVASVPPLAPFEAPAVNFMYASQRLRKDYYHRWVHNPLRLDPNTKMPAFEKEDGKTAITDVLDGDARKQFEAIWQYLLNGETIQPPPQ